MAATRLAAPDELHFDDDGLIEAAARFRQKAAVVRAADGTVGVAFGGRLGHDGDLELIGLLAPLYPEWLGDRGFAAAHGLRFPYVVGEMANGIASVELVEEAARVGALGMFGAAGLSPERVERELARLAAALSTRGLPWGSNLIHSPSEPAMEEAIVDLYLRHDVQRVSASAYMGLTPALVRYAASGLKEGADGAVVRGNAVIAKVSRPEVAEKFFAPAPAALLDALVARGALTPREAELARRVPIATDLTAEADSGGHTDNRPLTSLLPDLRLVRERVAREFAPAGAVRIGAAGGIGTPDAVAAAFALGAAYVLTGSVNQGCVEAGISATARAQLAQAGIADVIMAPAADMFELGVHVQVLRRGTMFAPRARRLLELYRAHASLDEIPGAERARLEREVLQATVADAWAATADYWARRDPAELARAEADPKHRMALLFRSYLGQSSRWAIAGDPARALDFQIWCGPAMGAFNDWVRGSHLEPVEARRVADVTLNLLEGAAQATRAQQLRTFGAPMPDAAFAPRPRPLA
jgi:trans-AT polyketide synthase/acyltransferase/oxidoreductase domain-containing protein